MMLSAIKTVTAMVFGALLALAVCAPQIADAHTETARADAERRLFETRCTVFVDGSATCPKDTFEVGK